MNALRRVTFLSFTALAFAAIFAVQSTGQINASVNYGLFLSGNLNFHSPAFSATAHRNAVSLLPLQGDTSARFAGNATSFGLAVGGMVNIPINSTFVISGRVGYNALGGSLKTPSFVKNPLNPLDSAASELSLESSLNYLEISPILQIHNLFEKSPLYVIAGFEAGIPISAKYSVSERIAGSPTIPAPATNPVQYFSDAAIANAGTRFALAVGAGWPIAIDGRTFITPEITYRMPFGKVSSSVNFDSWSVPQLRFGLNLTFSSAPKSAAAVKSTLQSGFDGVGYYDGTGNFQTLTQARVEDVSYSELFPMLPYVFFPQNGVIPNDSVQRLFDPGQKGSFSIPSLPPDAIEINKSTLDIIGKRMSDYPAAKLTITGTNDGKGEAKNKMLSQQRADYAKQYLKSGYGIADERLTVQVRDLPEKYSATSVSDGEAENRRIEFRSLTPEILDPILMKSDNQRIAFPDLVEFRPFARSNYPIINWKLSLSQAGRNLREYTGTDTPSPQRWLIKPNELSDKQVPIEYTFTAHDSSGASSEASGSIPVEYLSSVKKRVEQLTDRSIAKFSLVLFDFDKSEITPENRRILETLVLPSVQYNSTVKIFGYTDRIGDAEYNLKLSTNRAAAVKSAIEAKVKDAKFEIYGLGKSVPVFDNASPIGRHLSRTVQIYVETPK
ncbi:MAG: OmpA family protein [Bacteroidetes bacterium]|nr:OmpA family protein [Bacteroidota bacterium]MCZ2133505.1 OmpA family protein [Bacteroidota bacterium]